MKSKNKNSKSSSRDASSARTLKFKLKKKAAGESRGPSLKSISSIVELDITGIDRDGHLVAAFVDWKGKDKPPAVELVGKKLGEVRKGDRVLARLVPTTDTLYAAHIIKKLDITVRRELGTDPSVNGR